MIISVHPLLLISQTQPTLALRNFMFNIYSSLHHQNLLSTKSLQFPSSQKSFLMVCKLKYPSTMGMVLDRVKDLTQRVVHESHIRAQMNAFIYSTPSLKTPYRHGRFQFPIYQAEWTTSSWCHFTMRTSLTYFLSPPPSPHKNKTKNKNKNFKLISLYQ